MTLRGGGLGIGLDPFPRQFMITAAHKDVGNTGWDFTTFSYNASYFFSLRKYSGNGAQNNEIYWDVPMSAGTWALELYYFTDPSYGIFTILIDDVEVGTVDSYIASGGTRTRAEITGIAVATSGVKRIKLKAATTNASSTSPRYRLDFSALVGTRTA